MKKTLLLSAVTLMTSSATFAQWTRPLPQTPAIKGQALVTDGETEQYLYNVDLKGFMMGGNDWGTRASVSDTLGYKWKIVPSKDQEGEWQLIDEVQNQNNEWKNMFCDNQESIWVDNVNGANAQTWVIEPVAGANTFKIYNSAFGLSVAEGESYGYLGAGKETANTRLYLTSWFDNNNKGAVGDTWISVSAEEYETYVATVKENYADFTAKMEVYASAEALKDAIVAAKAKYPDLNYSAPEAVYNNGSSTKEELETATQKVQDIINDYLASQATFDDPSDMSEIFNGGADVNVWTREFTGTGNVGTWHTNSWSTEANNGGDGTDMTTNFCEDWTASGGLLSDQKISMIVKNAAPGLYRFKANVRLYNEAGNQTALTGCTMFFGDDSVTLDEQVPMYKSGNKCVLWKDGGFQLITVLEETGDIEMGFDIKDATFNWLAFKETSLTYYGKENAHENAVKLYKEGSSFEKIEEENYANPELVNAYNAAVDAYDKAATIADLKEAISTASKTKVLVDANHKAYEKLLAQITEWKEKQAEGDAQNLDSDEWAGFADFMNGSPVEGYPAITIEAINNDGDRSMTTEEVEAYINTVNANYAYAIAHSLYEGADCTDMLVNASYKEGKTGWTTEGNCALGQGISTFPVAESWHSKFNVYQVVEGVPDGLYSLSLNGFCRIDDQDRVYAKLYMNDFETTIQNIADGAIPDDENAVDGFNCYKTNGNSSAALTQNPLFIGATHSSPNDAIDTGVGDMLAPNGMEGASVAFSADRYKAVAYGLVEGGTMKLGIKDQENGLTWVLWGNFKLTYMGKNQAAVESVTEKLKGDIEDMLKGEDAEKMTEETIIALESVLDLDATYDNLIAINQAIKDANAQIALYSKCMAAIDKVYALQENDELWGAQSDELIAKAEGYIAKADEMSTLTEDEMQQIVDEVPGFLARFKIIGDWTKAKADNEESWVDLSSLFNSNFDDGNANGWTVSDTDGYKGKGYQSAEYTSTEDDSYLNKFVEAWRAGNVALADGKISTKIGETGYDFLPYLPQGAYTLYADVNSQNQGDTEPVDYDEEGNPVDAEGNPIQLQNGGAYLFVAAADTAKTELKSTKGVTCRTVSVDFVISEGVSEIEFGVMTEGTVYNWLAADNFRLVIRNYGGETTDIKSVTGVKMQNNVIYDLTGRQTDKSAKGIYIKNGKKFVVK